MAEAANLAPPAASGHSQVDATGRLRHLITLQGLSRETITRILDAAEQFLAPPEHLAVRSNVMAGRTVANLFFEPSTRTRASFELAAARLGADVLNLDVKTSSRKKGESILDTIYTLEAMQCDVFVVRDAAVGVPQMIADAVRPGVAVLNAGEAHVNHPTQGLLDALTLRLARPDLENVTLAIVGDLAHSRVARSAYEAFNTLGIGAIHLVAPDGMMLDEHEYPNAQRFNELAPGIEQADAIMALRIQHERIDGNESLLSSADYHEQFGITERNLKLCRKSPLIMHPGPMNRGVEIDTFCADGPRSLITEQVRNGVAIRMALLAEVDSSARQNHGE
ncbi:MAG: aspartate carbamoyltransferase catalytic subunit [Pseudomonadota bacterium]